MNTKIDLQWIFPLAVVAILLTGRAASDTLAVANKNVADLPTSAWPKSGGNFFNQNYSPLTQINRQNVSGLKAVWRARLDGSATNPKYSGEAQPLVSEGVVYIITGADDIFAISVKTGAALWKYQANLDQTITTVCCGWTSRGLALGEGKVYVGQLDGQAGRAGSENRRASVVDSGRAMAGRLHHHRGASLLRRPGDHRLRGRRAWHARARQGVRCEDGRLMWTFYTVPGPGEIGHDTWPQTATRGSTAARRSGRPRRSIPNWA